jgi:predicted lipoprotein with Yx(FWY)xxD motif
MNTMKKTITIAALLAALALLVSACGGGSDSGSGSAAGAAPGTTEQISVGDVDGVGEVLVDRQGVALYFSEEEAAGGMVLCTSDACTSFWDPLLLDGADQPTGAAELSGRLGTTQRPGGAQQVTFEGKPLYRFTEDSGPGVVSGDGFVDAFDGQEFTWSVATPSGESTPASNARDGFDY